MSDEISISRKNENGRWQQRKDRDGFPLAVDDLRAAGEEIHALQLEVERLSKAHYEEALRGAACLTIAEGAAPGWDMHEPFGIPENEAQRATKKLRREYLALQAENKRLREALRVVNEQAEDDGLWFRAQTAPEAYLQAALRRLHATLEDPTP